MKLYGTPQNRKVENETEPLVVDGEMPWKRIDEDPTSRASRRWRSRARLGARRASAAVYRPDGKLLYNTTWRSNYDGEPTVVRIGTTPRPKGRRRRSRRTAKPTAAATEEPTGAARAADGVRADGRP